LLENIYVPQRDWGDLVGRGLFKNVRCVAFDINGTLIGGRYHRWEDVFEKGLSLKKKGDTSSLMGYDVQTGRLSFDRAVSLSYIVERPETLREEAFKVYMSDLRLREGCIELLNALRRRYDLVVCSDTSGVTKAIVRKFGLEEYFSKFFYSIDLGWMKSDREFWTTFLSNFPSTKPEEFVMVGDNPRCDIHWPNVFGMGTIQIKTTEMLPTSSLEVLDEYDRPVLYVSSLVEISEFLLK